MKKFNDIKTLNQLADYLEISRKHIPHILYKSNIDNFYHSFEIPKKNGEFRKINAPIDELKMIQKKLATALWKHQKSVWNKNGINPRISHGFVKEKGIITNAKIHRNKRYVLNMDLENFFDSFHFGRVRGYFQKNKNLELHDKIAIILAQLTCYKGCLPQGAPSSPVITNMICEIMDCKILKIAQKYKLNYTRYADDLTFSTNNKKFLDMKEEFFIEITKIIEKSGFLINNEKTRIQFRDSKQEVTGLVVNKKLSVDRIYCKNTRAMAHSLYTKSKFEIDGLAGTINQLEGRFTFINQLDRYNNNLDIDGLCLKLKDSKDKKNDYYLNSRERQYQKFLFFKYFYSNEKPLIITEGKTDIKYIIAALKNLYSEYPKLIEKNSKGEFEFKISFLRRTKRLEYFFRFYKDGADAMLNLYYYFVTDSKMKCPNYFEYFKNVCFYDAINPVIFIFDNEITNNKKPLKKFTALIGLSDTKTEAIRKNLSVKLIDNANLFLLTNPLIDNKLECEIEDLFSLEVLQHKIGEKTFSRDKDSDNTKHYGKSKFADYIESDYENIDFSGFKKILDQLNIIIQQYKTP